MERTTALWAEAATDKPSAGQLSKLARQIYVDGPILQRKFQHWRPYICPFESLVCHAACGGRVLDVGCGAGLLLNLLAGLGLDFHGIGVDVSERAVLLARRAVNRSVPANCKPRVLVEQVSHDGAWPAGGFDVVFLVDVLHHIPPTHQEALFRRVASKVALGGRLIYKDMCSRPWWKAEANRLHDFIVARERISYVPVATVEQWGNSAGFEVMLRQNIGRLWYGHELRVMKRVRPCSAEDLSA